MSEIRLSRAQLDAIHQHGERTYPEECCGVMVGTSQAECTTVARLVEVDNRREDEHRHNRYLIEPRTVLEITRSARDEGLDIVGYYHSHPDHPARPSEFDRDHAWPNISYLIVSVCRGKVKAHEKCSIR